MDYADFFASLNNSSRIKHGFTYSKKLEIRVIRA